MNALKRNKDMNNRELMRCAAGQIPQYKQNIA